MIRTLIALVLLTALAGCSVFHRNKTTTTETSTTAASSNYNTSQDATEAGVSTAASKPIGSFFGLRSNEKTCDASALQSELGQQVTPSKLEQMRTSSNSLTARLLRPGQVVTIEYNDTRLNVIVDEKDILTAIRCG